MLCPCTYIYCSDGSIFFFIINQPGRNQEEKKKRKKKKYEENFGLRAGFYWPGCRHYKVKRTGEREASIIQPLGQEGKSVLRVDLLSAVFCLVSVFPFQLKVFTLVVVVFIFFLHSPAALIRLPWPREWHSQVNGGQLSITFLFLGRLNRYLYRWTARITDGTYSTLWMNTFEYKRHVRG